MTTAKKSKNAATPKKATSWFFGRMGVDRVRIFKHAKSGVFHVEWYEVDERGQRRARTQSTGTTRIKDAQAFASKKSSALREGQPTDGESLPNALPTKYTGASESIDHAPAEMPVADAPAASGEEPLYMSVLFDKYEEAKRAIGKHRTVYTRTAARLCAWFDRLHEANPKQQPRQTVEALDEDFIATYIFHRGKGYLVLDGKQLAPVRSRVLEEELGILRAALRWAVRRKLSNGARLLREMPVLTWDIPKELNPRRPMLDPAEYRRMIDLAWGLEPRLFVVMVVGADTGHRLSSIRQLHWTDINWSSKTICWQGANEKNGFDHETPVHDATIDVLRRYAERCGGASKGPLFPGSKGTPLSRREFYKWWEALRQAAGLSCGTGVAFHAFRRQLASDLATASLSVVQALGGWKDPHTVVQAYQQPSVVQQRAVLTQRAAYASGIITGALAPAPFAAPNAPATTASTVSPIPTPIPTPTP